MDEDKTLAQNFRIALIKGNKSITMFARENDLNYQYLVQALTGQVKIKDKQKSAMEKYIELS